MLLDELRGVFDPCNCLKLTCDAILYTALEIDKPSKDAVHTWLLSSTWTDILRFRTCLAEVRFLTVCLADSSVTCSANCLEWLRHTSTDDWSSWTRLWRLVTSDPRDVSRKAVILRTKRSFSSFIRKTKQNISPSETGHIFVFSFV